MQTDNITCRWARARLSLWDDGQPAGHDRRKIERHLLLCSDCRSKLESHREIRRVLARAAEGRPTCSSEAAASNEDSLWPALSRQLADAAKPGASIFRLDFDWLGRSSGVLGLLATCAAAFCLLLGGVLIARDRPKSTLSKVNVEPRTVSKQQVSIQTAAKSVEPVLENASSPPDSRSAPETRESIASKTQPVNESPAVVATEPDHSPQSVPSRITSAQATTH